MRVFAAHNPDEDIRRLSSSGGVFSMLATGILAQGGVVYGAAFDNEWNIVHRRVDKTTDLKYLRGSKYAYSKLGTSISNAMDDLKRGRKVLFSGTPCQAAAMRKVAKDNPDLLIVEVVCHGAPDPKFWKMYLDELCKLQNKSPEDILSIDFRDKITGWNNYSFTIRYNDGSAFSERHNDNIFMKAFLADLTLRSACYNCRFKLPAGSKADIILGDFWGIEHLDPQNQDKGISLIIINSEFGESIVSDIKSKLNYSMQSLKDAIKYNPAIQQCASKNPNRNLFQKTAINKGFMRAAQKCTSNRLITRLLNRISRFIHQ